MSKAKQEKTYRAARDITVQTFQDAQEASDYQDEFMDMTRTCLGGTGPDCVDTTTTTVERLMEDPRVKAAFKKFCTDIVGAMQYMESF